MDYLQYQNLDKTVGGRYYEVLNLVINGLPSILNNIIYEC